MEWKVWNEGGLLLIRVQWVSNGYVAESVDEAVLVQDVVGTDEETEGLLELG